MDKSELELQAEIAIPMPSNACVWVRLKIEYLREQWVKDYSNQSK